MNKPRSSVLRVLGVLVGVAFVATAPFIASDKGLPSFDGVAYLLVSVALGFVFIAYGVVRPARFPNLPLSLDHIPEASPGFFYLAFGSILLLAPGQTVISRLSGGTLLLVAVASIVSTYAKRRS